MIDAEPIEPEVIPSSTAVDPPEQIDPPDPPDSEPASKSRVQRTEYERALERKRAKTAAVDKLKQRIAVKGEELLELQHELERSEKQLDLITRMAELARGDSDAPSEEYVGP